MIGLGHDAPAILRGDVCIIGSGPAGTTVALELERRGLECILLESGLETLDPAHAALNETPQVGIRTDPTEVNRSRVLGGTSALWGGMCRPLDAMDFEARSWVPDSGWPISLGDLLPFYADAHRVLRLPDPSYDPARMDPRHGTAVDLNGQDFRNVAFFWDAGAMRFGPHYGPHLRSSERVRVFLDATVVNLEAAPDGGSIVAADFVPLGGERRRVEARRFVLAAGAIATARLLLQSDGVHRRGLGNERDLVGRYFLQHPVWRSPEMLSFDREVFARLRRSDGKGGSVLTAIRPESARRHQLLNFHVLAKRAERPLDLSDRGEVLRFLRTRLARLGEAEPPAEPVAELLTQLHRTARPETQLAPHRIRLEVRPEQAPNRDSRITLSDERDEAGMRRAVMDWRLSPADRESLRGGLRLLARSMALESIGRVRVGPGPVQIPEPEGEYLHGGHHHYGTARMSDSPRRGVVDRDCRVHGIGNLYVASSAVFPTTGYANPTLSIVALAARLAAHLDS